MVETHEAPPDSEKTSSGLEQNTAALLCYLFTWVTGLVFFLIEKENKFVRFHALQSILFAAALFVIWSGLFIVSYILGFIPFLGGIINAVLFFAYGIGVFVVWIMLMVKAYQGEMYKLPVIGDIAERNV